MDVQQHSRPTIGSLFAGIGGFDLGFERAGFRTAWQVEIDPTCRAVLADRFSGAQQFGDVKECGKHNLSPVDVITAGFPCQDISVAGGRSGGERPGLSGGRSGLFYEVIRILKEVQPPWVVLENVPNLLAVNDSQDFQTVVKTLADCGYVGFWRVLDARYFGVPQGRRRVFLVAGLGRYPPIEFLADAQPVEAIPRSAGPLEVSREAGGFAANTLLAINAACRIGMGCELLVAHKDGWGQMVERERAATGRGFCLGLDAANLAEARCAGNAVVPQVAEWIARHLLREIVP